MIAITRAGISAAVAKRTDQSAYMIDAVFEELVREMKKQLLQGHEVDLYEFGTLFPNRRTKSVEFHPKVKFAEQLSKLEDEAD